MGDDGDAGALIVVVNTDSHGDTALRTDEGGGHDIALVVGLNNPVNVLERRGVKVNIFIILGFEHSGVCLGSCNALLLGDSVLGDIVDNTQNTGDYRADKKQDECKFKYLFHYAPSFAASLAAFLAALSAAISSLDTPNW